MTRQQFRPHGYDNVVYAAEDRAVARCRGDHEIGMAAAAKLVREVYEWELWPDDLRVEVKFTSRGHGSGSAFYSFSHPVREIRLAKRGITKHLVLHELAHIIAIYCAGREASGHGKTFRLWYIMLLREFDPRFARSYAAAAKYYRIQEV